MKSIISKTMNSTFKVFITTSHFIQNSSLRGVNSNYVMDKFIINPNKPSNIEQEIKVNEQNPKNDIYKEIKQKEDKPLESYKKTNENIKTEFKPDKPGKTNLENNRDNQNNNMKIKIKDDDKETKNEIKDTESKDSEMIKSLKNSDKIELKQKFKTVESKVPSSSLSRAFNFGMLGASMIGSAIPGTIKSRILNDNKGFKDYLMSDKNYDKISKSLCKMRGAALKFGQLLSNFENVVIPEPLRVALEKARNEANSMPKKQFLSVMNKDLGSDWESKFCSFEKEPFAAASIGQVHMAEIDLNKLDSTDEIQIDDNDKGIIKVAVKVQFPGVSQSILSDLNNLKAVFKYLRLIPKGMYIDQLVDNLGKEIREECDYKLEAERQRHFYSLINEHKGLSDVFQVPRVFNTLSGFNILTSEFIEGVNVDDIENESQEVRDFVGEKLLELCLMEIFLFKFMQTDPNPANFFVTKKDISKPLTPENLKIGLIDFGAARGYSDKFVHTYLKIVYNASLNDKEKVIKYSQELGFLTGLESEIMLNAHSNSVIAIADPFSSKNVDEYFDFGNQKVTNRIYEELPVMLKHRLTSPPQEVYSLHRRLSGVYLTCIRLKSKVRSKKLFNDIVEEYKKIHNILII